MSDHDFTYCKGDPCTVHELHRFTILVPDAPHENQEANGYVVACSREHAEEAARIEGGEGTKVVSQAEGMDGDGYCPLCPDEDADDEVDEEERRKVEREARNDAAMEKWARAYDDLNGAPEGDDDR